MNELTFLGELIRGDYPHEDVPQLEKAKMV